MNYKYNKKYFNNPNIAVGAVMLVVGLLGLIGFSIGNGVIWGLLGILVVIIGCLILYTSSRDKPSDSELDRFCLEEISNLKEKALNKLGIDEKEVEIITPILLHGYSYKTLTTPVLFKTGEDRLERSSNYEAMILLFSENQVHTYKYIFSIIANEHTENADEYFYRDVVTVSTSSEKETIGVGKSSKTVNYEAFKLITAGGNSLVCALRDVGGTEKSIQGMRQLLRQKKM